MAKNEIIPYNKLLRAKARALRKNSTLSEVLLWSELKNRQLLGVQFHRQVPMLDYIVDFYCHELKLVIEVNGNSHEYKVSYDKKRQRRIETYGVTFLNFDDLDVKRNMGYVMNEIWHKVDEMKKRSSSDRP